MAYLCEGLMALQRLGCRLKRNTTFPSSTSFKFFQQNLSGNIFNCKSRILMSSATTLQKKQTDTSVGDLDYKSLSNDDWKKRLTPEQFAVCRLGGTELPHSGEYYLNAKAGIYICVCCSQPLFSSEHKYDCSCGWPTFNTAISDSIVTKPDNLHGMKRTEVLCSKCNGHLGHVFQDNNSLTHKSYCINSVALKFLEKDPKVTP